MTQLVKIFALAVGLGLLAAGSGTITSTPAPAAAAAPVNIAAVSVPSVPASGTVNIGNTPNVSVALAQPEIQHLSGDTAEAEFDPDPNSGCILRFVVVSVAGQAVLPPSTRTASESVRVRVFVFNNCTGEILVDVLANQNIGSAEFVLDRQLSGATLNTIIEGTDDISGNLVTISVNLTWVGTGAVQNSQDHTTLHAPGTQFISSNRGATRSATAAGSVVLGSTNLTPNAATYGQIAEVTSGLLVISRDPLLALAFETPISSFAVTFAGHPFERHDQEGNVFYSSFEPLSCETLPGLPAGIITHIFLRGADLQSGSRPEGISSFTSLSIDMFRLNFCTDEVTVIRDFVELAPSDFTVTPNLTSAKLTKTFQSVDPRSGILHTISVNLLWTGLGSPVRNVGSAQSREVDPSLHTVIVGIFSGVFVDQFARVTGSITEGSTNFTPAPPIFADLNDLMLHETFFRK